MKHLLFVVISLFLLGCGKAETQNGTNKPGENPSGEFLISVNNTAANGRSCANYFVSGTYDKSKTEAARNEIRSRFNDTSNSECKTAGSQGICNLSTSNKGTTVNTVIYFFAMANVQSANDACTRGGGTFK